MPAFESLAFPLICPVYTMCHYQGIDLPLKGYLLQCHLFYTIVIKPMWLDVSLPVVPAHGPGKTTLLFNQLVMSVYAISEHGVTLVTSDVIMELEVNMETSHAFPFQSSHRRLTRCPLMSRLAGTLLGGQPWTGPQCSSLSHVLCQRQTFPHPSPLRY